jgi:hypothetical protein
VAAEKGKNQVAWKEAKMRQIAVEAQKKLQEELKIALEAAQKLKTGSPTSKKSSSRRKKAGKRDQIESELKEIDQLLSMINP